MKYDFFQNINLSAITQILKKCINRKINYQTTKT